MTYFDVRIPGIEDDGGRRRRLARHPVTVDEFRIATAETLDVIVEPSGQDAFTIFAQAMDRTAYAAGTLAVRDGLKAPVPSLDPRPLLTHGGHGPRHVRACGTRHAAVAASANRGSNPLVDMQTMMPASKLDDPGIGLRDNGRRVSPIRTCAASLPIPTAGSGTDHRTAPDRAHGEVCVVVRRRQVRGRRTAAVEIRRAPAHRPRQRHDDDPPFTCTGCGAISKTTPANSPFASTPSTCRQERGAPIACARTRWDAGRIHCHLLFHMEAGMFREVRVDE